jgi:inhibitor of cysteine peptidase
MYGYWEYNYKNFYNRKVKVGDEICVWLKSNPSTGYSWNLDSSTDEKIVKKVSKDFQPPKVQMPGAGGIDVWKFKAVSAGKTKIILNYSRPFEKGVKPVTVKEFNITVQ